MTTKVINGRVRVSRETELTVIECNNCGVLFGLEREYQQQRRKDEKTWYCPNGCPRYYPAGPTEADKEREKRALAEKALDDAYDRLHSERKAHAATKGNLTKAKRRAAAGVCLHCNRTFQNVARHVQSQHPEAVGALGEEGE